jgi:hypothetical protein
MQPICPGLLCINEPNQPCSARCGIVMDADTLCSRIKAEVWHQIGNQLQDTVRVSLLKELSRPMSDRVWVIADIVYRQLLEEL